MPSCVEDDVVEGVIRCVFVDVDDGRGWARCGWRWSTDCIDSRGRVAGGTYVCQSRLSAGRQTRKKECRATRHINKSIPWLPAEAIRLQKHKGTSLS